MTTAHTSPVNDLAQQIEAGTSPEKIQLLLPSGKVRRSLSADEIRIIKTAQKTDQ